MSDTNNNLGDTAKTVLRALLEYGALDLLGLLGPTSFKNFYETIALCNDLNGNGTVEPEIECPAAQIRPCKNCLAMAGRRARGRHLQPHPQLPG